MIKSLFWSGVTLFALGALIFLLFVIRQIGGVEPVAVLPSGQAASGPSVLAIAVSSFGLAAGSALVGIGFGRWKRPRPSPHGGTPEG